MAKETTGKNTTDTKVQPRKKNVEQLVIKHAV